ncbi:MAG: sigma-70 family RNA polymerase sigma factor [Terriglobia bacterium]
MGLVWVSDKNLVQRVVQGELEAFDSLVGRWEKKLFNFALRLTGNRDEALDITQESFTKAFEQIRQLKDPEKFSQWLFRIARNCWVSQYRSSAAGLMESLSDEKEGEASIEDLLSDHFTVPLGDGHRFEQNELRLILTRALDSLAADQRETVVLKVFEGMKFSEIAEIVECPVSTVKSRLYLGLKQLKKYLTEQPRGSS